MLASPARIEDGILVGAFVKSGRSRHSQTVAIVFLGIDEFGPYIGRKLVAIVELGITVCLELRHMVNHLLAELDSHLRKVSTADKVPTAEVLTLELKLPLLEYGLHEG